jgi:hypothetical protein
MPESTFSLNLVRDAISMRLKSELTVEPGHATVLDDSNLQSTGAVDQWYNVGNWTQQRAVINA